MTAWQPTPLGEVLSRSDEIAEIQPDESYKEITVKLWGKGVVLRGIAGGVNFNGSRRFLARKGQLILSRIDARNGAIGIVPESLDGSVVSTDFPLFRIDTNRVLPSYVEWLSKTKPFVELCQRASEGTTNRVRLQEDRFLHLQVPLPPLPEQRRIVARIEELAAKINEARNLRRRAGDEAKIILGSAIQKALTAADSATWKKTGFGNTDLLEIIDGDRGKNYPQKMDFDSAGDCLFLNTGNVRKGFFDFTKCDFITKEKDAALRKGKVQRNDVILTTRGTLGNFACYDDAVTFKNLRINSGMVILRSVTSDLLPQYLSVVLNSPSFAEQVNATLSGSAQSQLPINKLSSISLLVPAIDRQKQIVSDLDALQVQVNALKRFQSETAAELDALLPSILDKAFTGRL